MTKMPRFDRLRQSLPEQRRTLLLKDTLFELTGAWKFFTGLSSTQTVFFYLPGFSALPLAFARNVARVEILGLSPEEQELLAEVATAKAIVNVKFLHTPADMQTPYATNILIPEHERLHASAGQRPHAWQETISRLQSSTNGAEEYWVILRQPARRQLLQQGKMLLDKIVGPFRAWRRPRAQQSALITRLCFMAANLPIAAQISEMVPPRAHSEELALMVSPDFCAPKNVFVAGEIAGVFSQFRSEQSSEPQPAGHVIRGQRPAGRAVSYLERLLLHLNAGSRYSWQPAGGLQVLPGGKAQAVLCAPGACSTTAALLKLPLIPHAAIRMDENAGHLLHLAQAPELSPEQRRFFPENLAQGRYESQAYYLETFLPGRSLDQLPAADTPKQIQAIFELWFGIQRRLSRRVKIDASAFDDLAGDLARRLQAWLAPAAAETTRLQRVVEYCHRTFAGRELQLSLVHGDFSIKNILVDAGTQQVTGVIDWDLADFLSVPLLDVLHFFTRLDDRSFRDPSPAIALRLTKTRQDRHVRYFTEAREFFGYRAEDWPALVMLYWLCRQRGYIGSDKNVDTKFVRRQFAGMLELFEREVLSPRTGVVV